MNSEELVNVPSQPSQKATGKVALCFLVSSSIVKSSWDDFGNDSAFKLFIHRSARDRNESIDNLSGSSHCGSTLANEVEIPTVEGSSRGWGKKVLFDAQVSLMTKAFADSDVDFVYFLSDSCIPLLSPVETYRKLFQVSDGFSKPIIHTVANGNMKRLQDMYNQSFGGFPFIREHNRKQSQWCGVNRNFYNQFSLMWPDFGRVWNSFLFSNGRTCAEQEVARCIDEHIIISFCSMVGMEYANVCITFVNWEDDDHPKVYSDIDELRNAAEGHVFARKLCTK
jgi:hypothetical protein